MKKKWKKAVVIVIVLAALIALVPYQIGTMKDGGSKTFKSLTYEILRYHKLKPVGMGDDGYFNGWRIEILGRTLCDDYEDYRLGLEPADLALPEDITDEDVAAQDPEDELTPDDDLYEPIPVPAPDGPKIIIPCPDGHYSSESGEYTADFEVMDEEMGGGRFILYHNGEKSASGGYHTEAEIYNGETYYYVWAGVEGVYDNTPDIHIATYYPDNDAFIQLEDIRVVDHELIYANSPGETPDGEQIDNEFAAWLYHTDEPMGEW